MLNEEKSHSKSQQRLMGMVYAYKNGDLDIEKLPESLSKKIKNIADGKRKKTGDKRQFTKGISKSAAKDYASTKHKGLPEKVEENKILKFNDFINETLSFIPGDNKKTNDSQILRAAIIGELDAINLYEQMADVAEDEKVKKLLLDISKEEKTHIGELESLLFEIDPEQLEEMNNGEKEQKEINKK